MFVCPFVRPPQALSGLKSALSGLKSALSGLASEREDFKPDRADSKPERTGFRPERAWGGQTEGRMDGRTDKQKSPVFYRTSSPSGPLPKKEKEEEEKILHMCESIGHQPLQGSGPERDEVL